MSNKIPPWTYSKIKLFDLCPRKYQALHVTKEVKESESEHLIYGNYVHKACENYVAWDKPIPENIAYIKPKLDILKKMPGDKLCEHRVGLKIANGKLAACDFFDANVWFRGIIDLLILEKGKARVVDYKTGKSDYADKTQLALMASSVFIRFSKIETIKAGLLFFDAKDFIKEDYKADDKHKIFAELAPLVERREKAYETGVFNPKQNFTCRKFCPVKKCKFNGG